MALVEVPLINGSWLILGSIAMTKVTPNPGVPPKGQHTQDWGVYTVYMVLRFYG